MENINKTRPMSVRLRDGTIMTRADLPPVDTYRWVASRKGAVVRAIAAGLITAEEACEKYRLSTEELASWQRAVAAFGERALKSTALQKYR